MPFRVKQALNGQVVTGIVFIIGSIIIMTTNSISAQLSNSQSSYNPFLFSSNITGSTNIVSKTNDLMDL